MQAKLIDTNVMLAASAIHDDLSRLAAEASPPEPELREIIYKALRQFEASDAFLVLDYEGTIRDEYEHKMRFNQAMRDQEYGMQVLQAKLDRDQVRFVTIELDESEGEKIARLSPDLTAIVGDRADRKWVACADSHRVLHISPAPIVYGAESDWYFIESRLGPFGIAFIRLLPDAWYESRHTK